MLEHQPAIDQFVASARAYCALMERAALLPIHQYAEELVLSLTDLYGDALRLPAVEPCSHEYEPETIDLPPDAYHAFAALHLPEDEDETVAAAVHYGLIADDLNDIYTDLRSNLRVYDGQTECSMRDAVWEWKFSFEVHWRKHLMHALYSLDRILREDLLSQEPGT